MTINLSVQIDDQSVPLSDCFWVRYNTTGCATGSVRPVTELGVTATAQDAQRDLVPYKRDRDREDKQGVRYELLTREQWRRDAKPCFLGECSHREAG